jgi:3-deoxy-D-manno-octulosonic-acid transferase
MLWLYRLLFLPVLVFASPYYLLRMKRRGGYRRHFKQRFGAVPSLPEKQRGVRRVWLQAVSVGEMLAIAPLLEQFKRDDTVEIYLTTTTSTGFKLAKEKYQEATIGIGYFPIDWWIFSSRAWKAIAPDLVVLTEGERWPEHVFQAAKRRVPVVCVNARLSDRSYSRMKSMRLFSRPLLRGLTKILACSELDAQRFRELGFPADSVTTTGNIKLDLTIPLLSDAEKAKLRGELGLGAEPILLGSSTWPGEEAALVATLRKLRDTGLACRLLIVPRHAERRNQVETMLKECGFAYHLRSRGVAPGSVDIAVADTTGELRKLTQLADVVFVGKSLPPHDQGQTPVEAAALEKAIVFGPGMSNFRAITESLLGRGAVRQVKDANELTAVCGDLLKSASERAKLAEAARVWHRENQGAVARTFDELNAQLTRISPQSPLDFVHRRHRSG